MNPYQLACRPKYLPVGTPLFKKPCTVTGTSGQWVLLTCCNSQGIKYEYPDGLSAIRHENLQSMSDVLLPGDLTAPLVPDSLLFEMGVGDTVLLLTGNNVVDLLGKKSVDYTTLRWMAGEITLFHRGPGEPVKANTKISVKIGAAVLVTEAGSVITFPVGYELKNLELPPLPTFKPAPAPPPKGSRPPDCPRCLGIHMTLNIYSEDNRCPKCGFPGFIDIVKKCNHDKLYLGHSGQVSCLAKDCKAVFKLPEGLALKPGTILRKLSVPLSKADEAITENKTDFLAMPPRDAQFFDKLGRPAKEKTVIALIPENDHGRPPAGGWGWEKYATKRR